MRRAIVHQKRRAVYGPLKKMESGHIPLLASQQGGVAASSRKYREATEADAAGVVFLSFLIGKPPRPRGQRMLRAISFLARPPLLAVMQGGEYAGLCALLFAPLFSAFNLLPRLQHSKPGLQSFKRSGSISDWARSSISICGCAMSPERSSRFQLILTASR